MATKRPDPISWNAPIVFPDTGEATPFFMRQWQQQFALNGGVSSLFAIQFVAGAGLSGGGVLGDLNNITFSLDSEFVRDLVADFVDNSADLSWTHNDVGDSLTAALTASGAVAGTYGNASNIPQITVDAKGRITSISQVAASGGAGGGGFFSGATGTFSTGNTTAFATKGLRIIPEVGIVVTHVLGYIQAAAAGESHYAQIASCDAAGNIVAVLGTSAAQNTVQTGVHCHRFAFSTPVQLVAGQNYVILVVNDSGTGVTPVRPCTAGASTSAIWWPNAPVGVPGPASRFSYNTRGVAALQAPSSAGTTYDKFAIAIEGTVGGGGFDHLRVMSRVSTEF